MNEDQLRENLNWLLLRVSILTKRGLIVVSDEYKLTVVQSLTLCLLEPDRMVPMNSISIMLGCDPSNVTGIIDRLEAGKYIERKESLTDRRVKTIKLTKTGNDLRNKVLRRITDFKSENLAALTAEEKVTLKKLLQKALPKDDKPK